MSREERKKEIIRELEEMQRRIKEKNDKKIKIYCIDAPKEVVDTIIKSVLDLRGKISAYNTINSTFINFLEKEVSCENRCMSKEEIGEYIYNTVKKYVQYLKSNYYNDIVGTYKNVIESEIKKIKLEDDNKTFNLLMLLNLRSYIESHNEYGKVATLIEETIPELIRIRSSRSHINQIFELQGCKEIFSEYEKRLNDIVSVKDINLKRAVWLYIDWHVEFPIKFD